MKYKINIIAAIVGLALFAACERNDFEPFYGKDNYIVSFALKLGDRTFDASIEENIISINVPEGLSLDGAKAAFKLSEHASIKPSPDDISGWDDDYLFAVSSYKGVQRQYTYTVRRTRIETEGTVILGTQAEVDAFGALGLSAVTGNLIIGRLSGSDSIESLLPLASILEVDYMMTINPTYKGENLAGLEQLQRVGDVLQIGACPHLETISLPALERVGGVELPGNPASIYIDMPALTRADGAIRLVCPIYILNLPALKEARDITLQYSSSASGSMLPEVSFPVLEKAENISVTYLANVAKINLPALKSAGNLNFGTLVNAAFVFIPQLETVGTIQITNTPKLVEIDFPKLVRAQNITLNQPTLQIAGFAKLEEVAILTINNTEIGGFASFPALKTASSVVFYYSGLPDLETISIPATVERIGVLSVETRREHLREIDIRGGKVGELRVISNSAKSKLIGDEIFDGILYINTASASQPYPAFPELEGFAEVDSLFVNGSFVSVHVNGIKKIRKSFNLGSGSSLPEASLPDLEEIGGTLKLFPFYNFTLEALSAPKLKRVGRDFIANDPGSFIRRLDFPLLETVGGNCNICTGQYNTYNNPQIEALLFPSLTSVAGTLTIRSSSATQLNTTLKNFDSFAALRTVGAISVTGQMAIESFDGLKEAARSIAQENWKVTGNLINPTYDEITQ
ncbi:MAG: hypothetical protein LBC98_04610 [Prevotellaceae bacterium]|jgi:hypothetical protein|nr:hypothetical protein [Prevotellaceae bacterium]